MTSWTVPASSLRRVIELRARTAPIAVAVGRYKRCCATADVMEAVGSGWLAAAASALRMEAYFHAASTVPVTTRVSSRTADRSQLRLLIWNRLGIPHSPRVLRKG